MKRVLWRAWQSVSWTTISGESLFRYEAFALCVRQLLALTFVPPTDMHNYMAIVIAGEAPRRKSILEFIPFFQDTCMAANKQQNPHAPASSVTGARVKHLARTNNSLEAWCCGHALNWLLAAKTIHQQGAPSDKHEEKTINKKLKTLLGKLDDGIIVGVDYISLTL